MVKLIVGNRGCGKTKALIDMVNSAAAVSKGNVICIEKGDALKFDLTHNIRLIDIEEYTVTGSDAYYGFIAGLLAGNYDITEIFCDATFKIICGKGEKDPQILADFITKVEALTKGTDAVITFTVSYDKEEIPASIKQFALEEWPV